MRDVIDEFKPHMVDVHLPTTEGREPVLSRYTQPEAKRRMLIDRLHLRLPGRPPPKIMASQLAPALASTCS